MEARNRRRLVLALALLVVALVVVLVRNRDFWFGTDEGSEPEAAASAPATVAKSSPAPSSAAPAANPVVAGSPATTSNPARTASPAPAAKKKSEIITKASAEPAIATPAPAAVPTARTQLPPLEVEVVAGDTHRSLRAGSNAVLVEIPTHSAASKTFQWNPVTNAAELTRMPSDLPERVAQAEQASYPSLGKQMKVQGAVILQAFVGADGGIKDLHVLSGNPILVSAAVEAARQWRFAPYMQNGQPVETQAKIQVNFTIKVL